MGAWHGPLLQVTAVRNSPTPPLSSTYRKPASLRRIGTAGAIPAGFGSQDVAGKESNCYEGVMNDEGRARSSSSPD